ncbi:hypothetical protein KKE60_07140 [Patescibacteria group bacterium]|nr:hypothetical protein [Patescibacteria group bacterium]
MKRLREVSKERLEAQKLFLFSGKRALDAGLSISDMARFFEVTPACVSKWFDGAVVPQPNLCPAIRRFHGVMQEMYPVEIQKTGKSSAQPVHVSPEEFRKQVFEKLFAY